MAPLIPSVAQAFHSGFMTRQSGILTGMMADGMIADDSNEDGMIADKMIANSITGATFDAQDTLAIKHLNLGPTLTLSLSPEMTAQVRDRNLLYRVYRIRASDGDTILRPPVGGRR
jgi:hypothetical protein